MEHGRGTKMNVTTAKQQLEEAMSVIVHYFFQVNNNITKKPVTMLDTEVDVNGERFRLFSFLTFYGRDEAVPSLDGPIMTAEMEDANPDMPWIHSDSTPITKDQYHAALSYLYSSPESVKRAPFPIRSAHDCLYQLIEDCAAEKQK